jgi:protein tyrosine phosphatase
LQTFARDRTQPWNEGVLPENKAKNRYNDLAAYDATRVHLPLFPIDNNKTDYINANYVDVRTIKTQQVKNDF